MPTPPALLQKELNNTRVKKFPKDQILVYEGDNLTEVGIIKSGAVKLYDINDNGHEKILHIVTAPAVIPLAFFSGQTATANWFYAALTDCEIYVFDQFKLRELMLKDKDTNEYLINNFSQNVHELLVRLSSLGKALAHDKIVVALRFLAIWHGDERRGGWIRVRFPVNQQLVADMVGITRERVAVLMKDLQVKKIVRNPSQTVLEIHLDRLLATQKSS